MSPILPPLFLLLAVPVADTNCMAPNTATAAAHLRLIVLLFECRMMPCDMDDEDGSTGGTKDSAFGNRQEVSTNKVPSFDTWLPDLRLLLRRARTPKEFDCEEVIAHPVPVVGGGGGWALSNVRIAGNAPPEFRRNLS